ncbi:MAG: cytochrome c oxidase assembly protein, partial [Acidobacteriaceae bacterium]|nr:cytochrome c oxidase assembly protein [Acidobacteriaceae bacterium]
ARLWKESESGGDHGAGGLSEDASSFEPNRSSGCFPRTTAVKLLFLAVGATALWVVVASPFAHLDHHLLTAHMAQHLVLMLLAAPLMLFGAPSLLTRWRPHPAFCWLAGTLTVVIWHVPAVFELALRSHFWHEFEQASFFIAGILFWWPVIRPASDAASSGWSVPLYLFFATLPCDALSAFLVFCGHVVYPHYLTGAGHFRLSPLEDQELAGALMWVTVTFAYLVPALMATTQLLSGERARAAQAGIY